MKKTITIVLFATALLFGYIGFAQENKLSQANRTWPEPGAKWTYCVIGWNNRPAGEEKWALSGDTLLNGKTWSMIKQERQKDSLAVPIYSNEDVLISRFSNDSIYRFMNNKEYLLFTYNLNVGDVLTTFRAAAWYGGQDSTCSSQLPLKVIEKSEVMLGSSVLQKFVLEDTLFRHLYPNYNGDDIRYVFIERIGVVNNYQFMNTLEQSGRCDLYIETSYYGIGKYSDDNFEHIYHECAGVGLQKHESTRQFLRIYPNPANSWTAFDFTLPEGVSEARIEITSPAGVVIHSLQLSGSRGQKLFDSRKLSPGVYNCSLITGGFSQTVKLIIQH